MSISALRTYAKYGPLTLFTFHVTDKATGNPVCGVLCKVTNGVNEAGGITLDDGACLVNVNFSPSPDGYQWETYHPQYGFASGDVTGADIYVELEGVVQTYNVYIYNTVGGNCDPTGLVQVERNTNLTITALPIQGYKLDHWEIGVNFYTINPITIYVDHDGIAVYCFFIKEEGPPPPPPNGEWAVEKEVHIYDNFLLNQEVWELSKYNTRYMQNIDMDSLAGGKVVYKVTYEQGSGYARDIIIEFNGNNIITGGPRTLTPGQSITDTVDVTGNIFSSNQITVGYKTYADWAHVRFDVLAVIGYTKEPEFPPNVPSNIDWNRVLLIGAGAAVAMFAISAFVKKESRPIIVVTGGKE